MRVAGVRLDTLRLTERLDSTQSRPPPVTSDAMRPATPRAGTSRMDQYFHAEEGAASGLDNVGRCATMAVCRRARPTSSHAVWGTTSTTSVAASLFEASATAVRKLAAAVERGS